MYVHAPRKYTQTQTNTRTHTQTNTHTHAHNNFLQPIVLVYTSMVIRKVKKEKSIVMMEIITVTL